MVTGVGTYRCSVVIRSGGEPIIRALICTCGFTYAAEHVVCYGAYPQIITIGSFRSSHTVLTEVGEQ